MRLHHPPTVEGVAADVAAVDAARVVLHLVQFQHMAIGKAFSAKVTRVWSFLTQGNGGSRNHRRRFRGGVTA